jgi:hypothetical protein
MFELAVQNGMALLDETNPGWTRKINLKTLDMGRFNRCVLGQIYFGYEEGVETLFDFVAHDYSYEDPEFVPVFVHGFDLPLEQQSGQEYAVLTAAWSVAIRQRL